jgi:predicted RNase H-like nuclease (RuvC/YqgF family)
MPSIEKRIKNLNKNVSKLEVIEDFTDKIKKYDEYKNEIDLIKNTILNINNQLVKQDILEDDSEYESENEDPEIKYNNYFKRLKEVKEQIETDDIKTEKLLKLYIECNRKISKYEEKLNETNIEVNVI